MRSAVAVATKTAKDRGGGQHMRISPREVERNDCGPVALVGASHPVSKHLALGAAAGWRCFAVDTGTHSRITVM